jgi:uncharacterized glyoxalase superfamily protein PhnB
MIDSAGPSLQAAVPILSVQDLPVALEYYQRVLGFDVAWKWGEPPRLAGLCRDRVSVNLAQSADPIHAISKVYFETMGIDAFYQLLAGKGAKFLSNVADRPYGMRDFIVIDPSGNELSFGEPTGTAGLPSA